MERVQIKYKMLFWLLLKYSAIDHSANMALRLSKNGYFFVTILQFPHRVALSDSFFTTYSDKMGNTSFYQSHFEKVKGVRVAIYQLTSRGGQNCRGFVSRPQTNSRNLENIFLYQQPFFRVTRRRGWLTWAGYSSASRRRPASRSRTWTICWRWPR